MANVPFCVRPRAQLFKLEVDFAAAPDVFPPDKFNAGVMVLKPSLSVLKDMLSKVDKLPSYDGGDTGERLEIGGPKTFDMYNARGQVPLTPRTGFSMHLELDGRLHREPPVGTGALRFQAQSVTSFPHLWVCSPTLLFLG